MKRFNILLVLLLVCFIGYGQEIDKKDWDKAAKDAEYKVFGEKFTVTKAMNASTMSKQYDGLKVSDTLDTNFTAKVKEVCQSKGCWMKLELQDGKEAMVRFKDYGFFVPMDISGRDVVVNGKAFVNEMSVADQRHYAEDAGASENELEKINAPKKTFSFLASGVILKE
ncbi:DUF4920 domain-containing protein [Costertonia aggregata]|uniref:DUF4920 domain-containing protein n=1 Tax=Costertonia aggregata TaxID=343403 RepID=A0A7H9ARY1_9FLAO|nr:DUF4920 domain-containing protein [Costertonia aggregata]QLG46251.1 DUF4920 domain-containing protein [Costertonia aggregata]